MHSVDLTTLNFANPVVDWINHTLPRVPGTVLGILIGILVVRLATRLLRFILKLTSIPKGLRQILTSALEIVLWILLIIQVLRWIGFGDVLVFFSSSALALGILLAAGGSTLLSDLVAGIFLARDGDFNVGDEVIAGENQIQGVIESMDVRRVRLRDKKGLLHVLPNSTVERKEWVIIKRRQELTPLAKAVQVAKAKTATTIKAVAADTKAVISDKKKARLRKNAQ